jgi:hypothetical protein
MIIWGSRGVSKTLVTGSFYCPACTDTRDFEHKKATRFFTLYFIPLIPMGDLGEYVECGTCKRTFVTDVLAGDPREEQNRARNAVIRGVLGALGFVARADGAITADERAAIAGIVRREFEVEQVDAVLDAHGERAALDPALLAEELKAAREHLTEHGKESLLRWGAEVARIHPPVVEAELDALATIGQGVDMSTAHVRGVIAEVREAGAGAGS